MANGRLKRKQVAEDGLSRLAQTIVGQLPMVQGRSGFDVSRCRRRKKEKNEQCKAMRGRVVVVGEGRSQDGSYGEVGTRSTESSIREREIDETSSRASEVQVTALGGLALVRCRRSADLGKKGEVPG